jgi:hypothetical protein
MKRNLFPWHGGAAGLLRCSFFLLVLALASEAAPRARPQSMRSSPPLPESDASQAYLPVIGPPPLRFAQAPPPELSTRPAPTAPPHPSAMGEIAATNAASANLVAPPGGGGDALGTEQSQTIPVESAPTAPNAPVKPLGNKDTPALLPDDAQRETRPEEILPFFQFPGSGRTTIVVPSGSISPDSTRLPVSTAVYRER